MPEGNHRASKASADGFAAWANGRDRPRFTDWLRDLSEPGWSAATRHRFTRELIEDVLDDEVFRRYLVQDYAFLDGFIGLIGCAIGHAPSSAARLRLGRFLAAVTSEENTYFERAFDALGVPDEDRGDPPLTPPTRDLIALMSGASREGYAEALAVLVATEWVYLSWARAPGRSPPARVQLAEWIDLHASEDFGDFVAWLRCELDRLGPALARGRRETVVELFRRAVHLEREFFDAAYGTKPAAS